jgi:hypothetical protein
MDRVREAIAAATTAIEIARRQGDTRAVCASSYYLARAQLAGGHLVEADRAISQAEDAVGDAVTWVPPVQATRAQILLARGEIERALGLSRAAYDHLEALGSVDDGEALVRLVHAECLKAARRDAEAVASIRHAAGLLRARAEQIRPEPWAEGFLRRIMEHRRTLELEADWQLPS